MNYLTSLRALDVRINQKIDELKSLRDKETSIGSLDYAKDRVQVSPKQYAPYADMLMREVDLDMEISAKIRDFIDQRHEIINEIQGMDDPRYIEVLYKRYVEYKTFEVIADEMNYNCDYVRQLHRRALQLFETSHKISHGSVV